MQCKNTFFKGEDRAAEDFIMLCFVIKSIRLQVFLQVSCQSECSSSWCVHGASYRGVLKPTTNMAAAVGMRTWSCPTGGLFSPWTVLFFVSLTTISAVAAAPETGLWKIAVVNVSILPDVLKHTC